MGLIISSLYMEVWLQNFMFFNAVIKVIKIIAIYKYVTQTGSVEKLWICLKLVKFENPHHLIKAIAFHGHSHLLPGYSRYYAVVI